MRGWTDDEFITAVKTSFSYAEVLRKLGLVAAGGNYSTVKRKIAELSLDVSHMTGQLWSKGKELKDSKYHRGKSLSSVLVKNSDYVNFSKLKKRIIASGLKLNRCECCGLTHWMGKNIPLELHHINGIKTDLRLENLQLLCPNCHSLTENYRGKNIRTLSARKETSDVEAG